MKKILGISLVAVFAAAPMMAMATPVAGSPTSYTTQPTGDDKTAVTAGSPLYQLAQSTGNDTKVATAGYVKGAYNAAIKAVNTVADTKQNTISDLATIRSGASAGATAIQSAGNGLSKSDKTLSAKASNGITVDSNGISVKAKTNGGITVDSNGVSLTNGVKGATATGTYTGTGLTTQGYVDEKVAAINTGVMSVTAATEQMANGTINVDGTAVAVKGLGSAAYTNSSAYATSTQGGKADTAIQSAGNGLSKSNTTLSVKAKSGGGITVDSDGVSLTNGVKGATATGTYTGIGLTTQGYVDEKVATATSGMVTTTGTQTLTNKTIAAGSNTISGLGTGNFAAGAIVTSLGSTGSDSALPTEKAVRAAITTATTNMAKQAGVVETIKDATFSGSISGSSINATAAGNISGSVVALTDWTDETKTTNATVTGSFSGATVTGSVTGTVNSTISNGSTLTYTES